MTQKLSFRRLFLSIMFGYASFMLQAQQTVSGTITSAEDGSSIPGATVLVKGTTVGAISDIDGGYTVNAGPDDVLVFSFVGFETIEEPVNGRSIINVAFVMEISALSEVVVMGYSEKTRRELTASAAILDQKELKNVTSSNVESMLQGKIAGVSVTTSTGAPGAAAEIRIRGVNSLTADRAPLVVVDGMIGGTYQPNDVASVTILKDAAATALYGSLASGGVMIVTTKSGSQNNEIEFGATYGRKQITTGNFSVMNGSDLYDVQEIMWGDDRVNFLKVRPDNLKDVNFDWVNEAYHPGTILNYYVAARGGLEKGNYAVSLDYYDEEGTLLNTGYDRVSFRSNFGFQLKDNVNLKTNFSVISSENNQDFWDWRYDPFLYLPWDNPYDSEGEIQYVDNTSAGTWYGRDRKNILHSAQYNYNLWKSLEITGNTFLTVDITDWLSVESRTKISLYNSRSEVFYDSRSREGKSVNGSISAGEGASRDLISTFLVRGEKKIGKHSLSGFMGIEGAEYYYEDLGASAWNVPVGLNVIGAAAEPISNWGSNVTGTRLSYLSELSYSYAGKYFLTGVFRADASSQFAPSTRWGYFPGLSAGWIVSSEDFFNDGFITFLKLRTSYGEIGNDNVGLNAFPYLSFYDLTSNYNGNPGATIPLLANNQITWETLISRNVGADVSIKDRFNLTLEYYNNLTVDMLLEVQLPLSSGFEKQIRNVGSVQNQGLEISLGGDILKNAGGLGWNTSINSAYNKSQIKELDGGESLPPFGTGAQQLAMVGGELRQWYMPKWLGVDPATGDPQWEKVNRDENGNVISREATSVYTEADYQTVGSVLPKWYGGWTNTLSYKGIQLSVLISYQTGNMVYHRARQLFDNDGAYTEYNLMELQDGWSRWEQPGDDATHPLPKRGGNKLSNSMSSRYLEDGSYIRLRNVSLSYDIPQAICNSLRIKSLNIALSGDNLHTWTRFSGLDPEARISNADFELPGLQDFKYPISKQYLLKLTAKF